MDSYDKTKIYNEEIQPLIATVKRICIREKLPFFFTTAVANKNGETQYINELVAAAAQVHLNINHISDILLYLNGFELKHPDYVNDAIRVLNDYISRISASSDSNDEGIDIEKHIAEHMANLNAIVEGDAAIQTVTEEYWEENF